MRVGAGEWLSSAHNQIIANTNQAICSDPTLPLLLSDHTRKRPIVDLDCNLKFCSVNLECGHSNCEKLFSSERQQCGLSTKMHWASYRDRDKASIVNIPQ
jgi:hypothetical protein